MSTLALSLYLQSDAFVAQESLYLQSDAFVAQESPKTCSTEREVHQLRYRTKHVCEPARLFSNFTKSCKPCLSTSARRTVSSSAALQWWVQILTCQTVELLSLLC